MPTNIRSNGLAALLRSEAGSGLLLIFAAALALVCANSPFASLYFGLLHAHIGPLDLLEWINDGLMAVFFLLVGLEIKREALEGQLSSWGRRALPGLGALGGMIVPAAIYLAFNSGAGGAPKGWAIPAATDIAFALGVLAIVGRAAAPSLKVFLSALAVIDDLGAVLIIALFYTAGLSTPMLAGAGAVLLALAALNRAGVRALWPYLLLGLPLWGFVFGSGVHATVAGVLLAFCIPLRSPDAGSGDADETVSPLLRLEHAIAPYVNYLIVPVFGFANAGVAVGGLSLEGLAHPVTLGVAAGLFLGKQIGVFSFCLAAIRLRLAPAPQGASLLQLYGVAVLCGVGFTMSLFVGMLAFPGAAAAGEATKIGVLAGSILSAALGGAILKLGGGRGGVSG